MDRDRMFKLITTPVAVLSSKVFLLWMVGGWFVYYVISSIWMDEAFVIFASGVRQNPFIMIPFIIFLLSGYMNFVRVLKSRLRESAAGGVLWCILPLGLLIFLTGFILSLSLRESGRLMIGEGNVVKPPWVREIYNVTKIIPGIKDSVLDSAITQGVFSHEPGLTLVNKLGGAYEVGAFPPSKINNTYYHILNFGIAPGVRLFEGDSIRYSGFQPIRILTPGSSDFFEIPKYPYRFLITLEAERVIQTGSAYSSQYNLKIPLYHVRVYKGSELVAEGDSSVAIRFDNFTLNFFKHTYWAMLEAAKDPGQPVLKIGLLFILLGGPVSLVRGILRAFRFSREIQ